MASVNSERYRNSAEFFSSAESCSGLFLHLIRVEVLESHRSSWARLLIARTLGTQGGTGPEAGEIC
jgi:hypothetical protein